MSSLKEVMNRKHDSVDFMHHFPEMVPGTVPGIVLDISRTFSWISGNFPDMSWNYSGHFHEFFLNFPGHFLDFLETFMVL